MKNYFLFLLFLTLFFPASLHAMNLSSDLSGKILLQVENNGEAWWVNPNNKKRYFLGRPKDAFTLMREHGLGISNTDIKKIPTEEESLKNENQGFINKLKGKILLQVENNGEAWYVHPETGIRYFMGKPKDAFFLMRRFGLGISNENINKIYKDNTNETAKNPRLVTLKNIQFEGAFRFLDTDRGKRDLNYGEGPMTYNPDNHSLFVAGHPSDQKLGEFLIPELIKSNELEDLNLATKLNQKFVEILPRTKTGNPQKLQRLRGMHYFQNPGGNPMLAVNGIEYYDADGNVSHTTLMIRNANDIKNSKIDGFYELPGAAHAAGWISEIPKEWQNKLGGTHLAGHSSGTPINGRHSIGPSAFAFNPIKSLVKTNKDKGPIETIKLLDYSLDNGLVPREDLNNNSKNNDLWTYMSQAAYGFIPPGTDSYVVIGYSAGHKSGVGYKITQDTGKKCGGYCPNTANDSYPYYWIYKVEDLIKVKNGEIKSFEVRPYEYGIFPSAFSGAHQIGGGTYDPNSETLYLSYPQADLLQGRYSRMPVVAAYKINLN